MDILFILDQTKLFKGNVVNRTRHYKIIKIIKFLGGNHFLRLARKKHYF